MVTITVLVGLVSTSLNNRYLLDNVERHVHFNASVGSIRLLRPTIREQATNPGRPSGALQRRITVDTRREIVQEYREGASSRTLHAKYGIAKASVIKIVREAGEEPRPPHSRKI